MRAREKYRCKNMSGWQGVLLNFYILHLSYSHKNLNKAGGVTPFFREESEAQKGSYPTPWSWT